MANFRTKARAIDLLGRNQIADLPTAITELWKNGYDAYTKIRVRFSAACMFIEMGLGFCLMEEQISIFWNLRKIDQRVQVSTISVIERCLVL